VKKIPPPNLKVIDTAIRYLKKNPFINAYSALECALETHYKWPSDGLIDLYADQYKKTIDWYAPPVKDNESWSLKDLQDRDVYNMTRFRTECILSATPAGPLGVYL
jgi:hypothetical protein